MGRAAPSPEHRREDPAGQGPGWDVARARWAIDMRRKQPFAAPFPPSLGRNGIPLSGSPELVAEMLVSVMPDSNAGKVGTLLLLALFGLAIAGRFKLEWIGLGIRHIFRWLRCKTRNRHIWEQCRPGPLEHPTGPDAGTFVCVVCGKVEIRK